MSHKSIADSTKPFSKPAPALTRMSAVREWLLGPKLGWLLVTLSLLLFLVAFVGTWQGDDGHVACMLSHMQKTGELRYLQYYSNAKFSFGRPFYSLLSAISPDPLNPDWYFIQRLPSAGFAIISLWSISACLWRCIPSYPVARGMSLIGFCALWEGLADNVGASRADSPYMAGTALTLLAAIRVNDGKSWNWFLPAIVMDSFAAMSHPNGFISVACLGLAVVYFAIVRSPGFRVLAWFSGVAVTIFCIMALWTLHGRSPTQFLADLQIMAKSYRSFLAMHADLGFGTGTPFFEELARYRLLWTYVFQAKLFVWSLILSLMPFPLAARDRIARFAWIALWISTILLAFQPTKWAAYTLVLIPMVCLLAPYNLARLFAFRWQFKRFVLGGLDDFVICGRGRTFLLSECLIFALALQVSWLLVLDVARQARSQSLLDRWVNSSHNVRMIEDLNLKLRDKTLSAYSDPRVLPLFRSMDLTEWLTQQPDIFLGGHYPIGGRDRYLIVARYLNKISQRINAHPDITRFPPKLIKEFLIFGDVWQVYLIPGEPTGS